MTPVSPTHGFASPRAVVNLATLAAVTLAAQVSVPATALAAQKIVESEYPAGPNLTFTGEPLVRIGVLDGPTEYIFGEVTGAIRLEDGSVVVADEQSYEVRMFDPHGQHVWKSGRRGEGPGEYRGLRLLRGCTKAAITVFDWVLNRITEIDTDGNVTSTRALGSLGVNPYNEPLCSLEGGLVFTPWPETDLASLTVGEIYRWNMSLNWVVGDGVTTLRSGIPGTERLFDGGTDWPRLWGKDMVFAVSASGVWYGSGDDYELKHVDWTGSVTRIARWGGPELEVTAEHLDHYLRAFEGLRFSRKRWQGIRDDLPEQFPAFESGGLLALSDGSLWVTTFASRAPDYELHLLNQDGAWVGRLTLPVRSTLLDAGPDWVLLLERGEFDEHGVALYDLVKGDDSG